MALVTTIFCRECGRKRQVTLPCGTSVTEICNECSLKAKDKARREWLAGREGLLLEERIREIEEFMYDHQQVNHYRELRC